MPGWPTNFSSKYASPSAAAVARGDHLADQAQYGSTAETPLQDWNVLGAPTGTPRGRGFPPRHQAPSVGTMVEPISPRLAPLSSSEHSRAGALLGRAFVDDPLWREIFSDPDTRPELLASMFTALTKATVAARGVAETSQELSAVALWLPPGRNVGFGAMVKSRFALPRFALALPADDRKRMLAVLSQLEERKKALMPNPHWYLAAVGVSPDRQGEGLGSALVRSGLRKADMGNVSVYLETETEDNVRFYAHLGFNVIEQVTAAGLDLPVWLMTRLPAGS